MTALTSLYENRRVVVCVGTGGVGKTTVAASLALAAAHDGRRVLVMTIDPSLRLAQALGIDLATHTSGQPVPVTTIDATSDAVTHAHGAQTSGQGTLAAKVLDVQAIFDNLVKSRAQTPERAQEILQNRIYRHFSASMAGSHEYAAVEALWDAYNDPNVDLVILDTPPSQHAVDFLEAPERILHFLQGNQLVEKVPGAGVAKALSRKLFDLGGTLVTKAVSKVSGAETLQDVLAFLHGLSDMYDSFRLRAEGVGKLLRQPDVAFLLVGAPTQAQLAALAHFVGELDAHGIAPRGFVLNRMRPDPRPKATPAGTGHQAVETALAEAAQANHLSPADLRALEQAFAEEAARAQRDQNHLLKLQQSVAPLPVWTLHEMPGDADSRRSLEALAQILLHKNGEASS